MDDLAHEGVVDQLVDELMLRLSHLAQLAPAVIRDREELCRTIRRAAERTASELNVRVGRARQLLEWSRRRCGVQGIRPARRLVADAARRARVATGQPARFALRRS